MFLRLRDVEGVGAKLDYFIVTTTPLNFQIALNLLLGKVPCTACRLISPLGSLGHMI